MKVLGLDTATKTGWAVCENGKITDSGVQDFQKRRGESNGGMFLRFRKWLADIISAVKPDLIIYEQAHHRGGAATEVCVNLTGRVQEVATAAGIEYARYATGEIKRLGTGKGKASKEEMIIAAAKILGRDPIDDNEADAVIIAFIGGQDYGF
jgi:Holliday junction resolvasome RuvABC endonuclease subunit